MAITPLVSGVIGAGNLISQAYWNRQNIDFQSQQNARNRQMTWDLWNAENRYNSPAAQMARLRAAGLNPGLMYSDGSAGMPAAATHSPEQTAPQGKPLYLDPNIMANARLADAQADLAKAQANSVEAKTPHEVNVLQKQIDQMQASIDGVYSQIDLNDTQAELNKAYGREVAERVTHWIYENKKTAQTLDDFVRKFKADADITESEARMSLIKEGQYERELDAYRFQINSAAKAALAAADKDSQYARDIEAKLKLFNETYETQKAIIRETRNDIVAGKQLKTSLANQSKAVAGKVKKETKYVGWRNITGGISDIVSSGADVISVTSRPGTGSGYSSVN